MLEDKIMKWAKANGYMITHFKLETKVLGIKVKLEKYKGNISQNIFVFWENLSTNDLKVVSTIDTLSTVFQSKQQIQDLFIPMNRVKEDEESLKKYILEKVED